MEAFQYHEETDTYICPNGKVFKLNFKTVGVKGIIYRGYRADEKDCTGCKLKEKCLRKGNSLQRQLRVLVGSVIGNLTKMMKAKIDSEKGRKIYPQRFAVVEPVFANIETQKRMDRFTLRSKIKVDIQWMLYCMVHNIGKILKNCPDYRVA